MHEAFLRLVSLFIRAMPFPPGDGAHVTFQDLDAATFPKLDASRQQALLAPCQMPDVHVG